LSTSGTAAYESGLVLGKYMTDKICVSGSTNDCITTFKMLGVESMSNMPAIKFSGLCGLPPIQNGVAIDNQLIPSLKAASHVTEQVFQTRMRGSAGGSKIEFFNPTDIDTYFFTSMDPNPTSWQLTLLNDNVLGTLTSRAVVFDSSAQFIYVPPADLEILKNNMQGFGYGCSVLNDVLSCSCNATSDSLNAMFPYINLNVGTFASSVQLSLTP